MARLNKGILGGISGKIGTVVGANFRGENIIRSAPSKSDKAATERQQIQRVKFAAASKFLQPVNAVLTDYFGSARGIKSRRNLAMGYTLSEVITFGTAGVEILYSKVLLTKGELAGFQNLQMTTVGSKLVFGWEDNSAQGNASAGDIFCTAVYCESEALWDLQEPATRQEASAEAVLPTVMGGKAVQVYVYFRSANLAGACTSVNLGTVTLP